MGLLVPLAALLETESVGRAAGQLGLSQPATSRILGRLRIVLGDPLLVREGGRMRLTPRAEALRAPLGAVLNSAEHLLAKPSFDPSATSRTFSCVMPDVIAAHLLPRALERLAIEAPGCRLRLHPWLHGRSGDIDFVITTEPGQYPQLRMTPLYEDRDVLAHRGTLPEVEDILELEQVAVIPAGLDQDPVDRWLSENGRRRNVVTTVPHYLLAVRMVAATDLVAILPSRLVAITGLRSRSLDFDLPPDRHWLLYPAAHETDPASRWIRALIEDCA